MTHPNQTPSTEPSPDAVPESHRAARRRDRLRGALSGALATILTLAAAILISAASGRISFLDASAELTLDTLPLRAFAALRDLFGNASKSWLLAGLFAGFTVTGALLGVGFARATAGSRRIRWDRGLVYAFGVGLACSVILLLSYGTATGGPLAGTGAFWVFFWLAASLLVYALSLPTALALLRRLDPPPIPSPSPPQPAGLSPTGLQSRPPQGSSLVPLSASALSPSRRRLLTRSALLAAGLAGLSVLGREVVRVRDGALAVLRDTGTWSDPITANDDFYRVSKNFRDPNVDNDDPWSITVDGLVANPLSLTRADLEALAGAESFVSTLTCISNEVGGPLLSTARWTGAPLAAILAQAGVQPGARKVIFHGRDDYSDSIPVQHALAPEPHLVWGMNGVDLPDAHGYPVRAIVPGLYGIKNVKWLERIEVTDEDFMGYWQRRDWTDTAVVKTSSRFDLPVDRSIVSVDNAQLAGVAFGGDRGISRVEVSTDDGETWHDATITDQPGPPISWIRWSLPWTPAPGTYTLVVRATDDTGVLQTVDRDPPLPDGSSGWHTISVGIVAD